MNLLIVTQKVDINDDVLGFFHDWIKEFSKNCEKLTVICLEKGEYELPDNVSVYSLGKENNQGGKRIAYLFNFYKLIWKYRNDYDRVFVHMIPMYANIGVPVWKLLRKKLGLWYAHGHVSWVLRIAEKMVDNIFTASKESFRINSKKLRVLGHGINLEKFKSVKRDDHDIFQIVSVGRIAPIKKYQELIAAIKLVKDKNNKIKISFNIIGGPIDEKDESYLKELEEKVKKSNLENYIRFVGSIPHRKIDKYLSKADLFLHASQTGSLDKVILEAMAMGLMVISSNEASRRLLGNYGDRFIYKSGDQSELAFKIKKVMGMSSDDKLRLQTGMREIVKTRHSLNDLIKNIIDILDGEADR